MVVLFCYFIGHEINKIAPGTIDIGLLLSKAIAHDFDELVTGDIPRPTKYHSNETRAMFSMIEKAGIERIIGQLEMFPAMRLDIKRHHGQAKEGPEGSIVALADLLAVAYKVFDEVLVRQNHSMIRQAKQVQGFLTKVYENKLKFFDTLIAKFLYDLVSSTIVIMQEAAEKENGSFIQMEETFDAN